MDSGEAGRLYAVMAAMARPVRLTRGKDVDAAWMVQVRGREEEEELMNSLCIQPAFSPGRSRISRAAPALHLNVLCLLLPPLPAGGAV